ncbi:DUF411 domain-containing protein [Candidatus Sororendozoicomonas aggregata]|uniref:DUF411 domain-containing protein n=1 Tax=Candidatus Sororendozoicomonas aggregata TaxID=3073239 RepID=UPI002ED04993
MEANGFTVKEKPHDNMDAIKRHLGITNQQLHSCHTAEIDGYVFEGHIPADDIKAFLENPPRNAKGLTVPGMPMGSPGMEYGNKKDSYSVYVFNDKGEVYKYSHYKGNVQ